MPRLSIVRAEVFTNAVRSYERTW